MKIEAAAPLKSVYQSTIHGVFTCAAAVFCALAVFAGKPASAQPVHRIAPYPVFSEYEHESFLRTMLGVPADTETTEYFHKLIRRLNMAIERDPGHRDYYLLMIGDMEHWLGHIYEHRGWLPEALACFQRSLVATRDSRFRDWTVESDSDVGHAQMHVQRTSAIIGPPITFQPEAETRPSVQLTKAAFSRIAELVMRCDFLLIYPAQTLEQIIRQFRGDPRHG